MQIRDFTLERFFARHEFAVRYVLGASDVDGVPMSEVLAAADPECERLWSRLTLGYTESLGLPLLRAEIAKQYPGLDADDVMVFTGAEEGIFIAMHAALDRGEHVVVVTPAYQSLYELARSIGAEVSAVPLDEKDWSLDLDRLAAALTPRTTLLVVNFPHSPTGAHITREQQARIVELCGSRGVRLFSDEVYRQLELDTTAVLPAAASLDPRAISLGVMSKAYGMGGLRIGWIATRDAGLRRRMAGIKDYTTICGSAPSEILALIALRASATFVGRSRRIIESNLPILTDFIRRNNAFVRWTPPRAGSVAFPRFVEDVDAERAAEQLIDETGVMILPGARFDYQPWYFRVGLGRSNMPEALSLIEPRLPFVAVVGESGKHMATRKHTARN
jgi:aspartate/methionine/tyrosine aminotransferase